MTHDPFDIAGASDVGRKREENQDHYLIAKLRRELVICDSDLPHEDRDSIYGCSEGRLLVIADGMGGHHDGERASRTAVEQSALYVLDMMHWFLKLSSEEEDDFVDELSSCLTKIQEQIWSQGDQQTRKMGTTVTMAYLLWPKLFIVHAGDSRAYLLRDRKLRQLTTDHTVAQQLLDAGALSEEGASKTHWRHVLWNCVGGGEKRVKPEVVRCDMQQGDVLLLCSDGLTGMVSDEEIQETLLDCEESLHSIDRLVSAANQAGGTDNISAIVCAVGEVSTCEDAETGYAQLGTESTIIEST